VEFLLGGVAIEIPATSEYSHHTWLGYWLHAPATASVTIHRRHVAHNLTHVRAGGGAVRSLCRLGDHNYHLATGNVEFFPADQEIHTLIITPNAPSDLYFLMIPLPEEEDIAASEGMNPLATTRTLHACEDVELQRCMMRLASRASRDSPVAGREDEASRQLILRLLQLSGRGVPEWHADGSVFDRRTLGQLVEYIDAHLKVAPCLSDMCVRVGLSPSHFARKFRQSTGLSLHRFINRRRILSAFELLRDRSRPLADTALELGFSSQSHFTRLFSGLTGMTPAKYRKQVKRAVG
jgi:AraC-like DNA-binding protein